MQNRRFTQWVHTIIIGTISLLLPEANAASIGWFYALDADMASFVKTVGRPTRISNLPGGTPVSEFQVGKHKVYAARMGSGCVATAVTVARVTTRHALDRVISTGPAGVVSEKVKPGEWVRISKVIPWQKTNSKDPADPPDLTNRPDWPPGRWLEVPAASLVSGEVFVASTELRAKLASEFGGDMVEMNSFGLLSALEGMRCKTIILRIASDSADESASQDFQRFTRSYQGEGGRMVADMVKSLQVELDTPSAHDALRELLDDESKE